MFSRSFPRLVGRKKRRVARSSRRRIRGKNAHEVRKREPHSFESGEIRVTDPLQHDIREWRRARADLERAVLGLEHSVEAPATQTHGYRCTFRSRLVTRGRFQSPIRDVSMVPTCVLEHVSRGFQEHFPSYTRVPRTLSLTHSQNPTRILDRSRELRRGRGTRGP